MPFVQLVVHLAAIWSAACCYGTDAAEAYLAGTHSVVPVPPANPAADPCRFGAAPKSTSPTPSDADLRQLQFELTMPVAYVKPTELRDTFDEMRGKDRRHSALDIMAPRGTPVLSAAAGCLLDLHENANGGLMIFATDPANRFILMYAHLDSYAEDLREGMPLERGQILGTVGTTGNAPPNAPHLHFAIGWSGGNHRWSKAVPVNPRPLLIAAEPLPLPEMRAAERPLGE